MSPFDGLKLNTSSLLPKSFYEQNTKLVAKELLGKFLRCNEVVLRITETEAYCWPDDSANHGFKGITHRNKSMWGPAGHAYVYLIYGLHHMLNFVTGPNGVPCAVLIRACEPVAGIDFIIARRGQKKGQDLLVGPGRVAQALAIDLSFCQHPLFSPGGLEVHHAPKVRNLIQGARIGIDYAQEKDRLAPLRFADGDSDFVIKKNAMAKPQQHNLI